ncbi:SSS family solute:Na+ symporter [Spinactinospora alkalitolerans]|uniref:SSS family solute:Na+ symporter n=1 Tax=Spinactinospora alkalitolerans TaxID=687207 RepID=A0A852TSR5_9ACTN|nr:sodium:solute symporter family protein [Spinactinospora alkalitolerans]NYE47059.1 SSS family solute:Na+ symporter [Spinactinospora alkalitolerans]
MLTTTFLVSLAGMAVIALLGLLGRKKSVNLSEWTVGGRDFGALSMWFLQAGESFTTFTFLAVAGLAFTGGAAATYAIPYIPLSYLGLFFIGPMIWRLGKEHGYITQADFYAHRYSSPLFGRLVAVIGVVFLLPYLQLQITGLGLIVELVTGDAASGTLSMIVATVLMVAFVLWSGIRGIATTAYFKDALVIVVIAVIAVLVPMHYAGGIGALFEQVRELRPEMLTVGDVEGFSRTWWFSNVLVSALGSAFLTLPHMWPPMLASRSAAVIRTNNVFLPLYQVVIILPIIVGFTGLLVLDSGTRSDAVLLTLAAGALPDWATGVVAVAAAATAMVPGAAMCLGISTLVANNLVTPRGERARFAVNHGVVVASASLALVLGILRPDLLANLLLLTFSGLTQLAPALLAAIGRRRLLDAGPAMLGMLTGVGAVIVLTFTPLRFGDVSEGVVALVVNVAVAAAAQLVLNARRRAGAPEEPTPSVPVAAEK